MDSNPQFSIWRERLWPVHWHEHRKLVPMLLIKFFITFIYTILKDAKDTLIVTSAGSGAEAIPVLKGWLVLPAAFVFMFAYSRLSDFLSRRALFYTTLSSFLVFFFLYGFVLYPLRDVLCPHQSADAMLEVMGKHRQHWIAVYRYWMNSLFFVAAELWGGMAIGVLFWDFANQITKMEEAKRFYAIFSAGGDLAVIIAGPLIWYYSNTLSHLNFELTLQVLMGYVLVLGLFTILTYYWFDKNVLSKEATNPVNKVPKPKKKKPSFFESLRFVLNSPYLYSLGFMIIAYGLSFNLVEVAWKAALKLKYPDPHSYQSFMGKASLATGVLSLLVTLFVGGNVIRHFGWFFTAQLTPAIIGISSLLFFYAYLGQNSLQTYILLLGITPLTLVIFLGAVHNVLGKTAKYSFFDPTKEMAFIPLDEELKVKGKAAVDVVAARLGKSGSSWIQVAFIELFGTGSILGIVHWLLPFVLFTVLCWVYAIKVLNQYFIKADHDEEDINEASGVKQAQNTLAQVPDVALSSPSKS